MCENCGCGSGTIKKGWHRHDDGTEHKHSEGGKIHTHEHKHVGSSDEPGRIIEINKNIFDRNNYIASDNRRWFEKRGILAVNIISSPGAGKTMLLEKTLDALKGKMKCAVITGDIETNNDAERLEGRGAKIRQIQTHGACHLNAEHIAEVLPELSKGRIQLLFIENVGNLVCPASFELGEKFKIALHSVTEGEDKPVKYPEIFSRAELAIITKTDLLPHLEYSMALCRKNIRLINPRIKILELSSKTGNGMEEWLKYLEKKQVTSKINKPSGKP